MLTERPITHGAILVRARPIGGLRLLDRGQADDKILAVLVDDPAFGHSARSPTCRARSSGAYDVIRAAIADYEAGFPPPA